MNIEADGVDMNQDEIFHLIQQSGDTKLEMLHYEHQYLCVNLHLFDQDRCVILKIKTQHIINHYIHQQHNTTCYLQLKTLRSCLNMQNGIYVASASFHSFKEETQRGLNLAYGLRVS